MYVFIENSFVVQIQCEEKHQFNFRMITRIKWIIDEEKDNKN